MIPLFVDCSRRRIVIFGGGEVAARKAAYFAGKAEVTIVSRSFGQKILDLPAARRECDVSTETDASIETMLDGAFLVIGALSEPAQNNRIGRLCRDRGILFNNADGEPGDVILPSVSRGTGYTLAISTGGSSPAVSRFIREHLEHEFPAMDRMIALQQRLRAELKRTEPDPLKRNAILREVLNDTSVWTDLSVDPAGAWDRVNKRYLHD
ncbi:MAG: siroheme synthase [Methanomicrobiales archaeon HGW-Methanomicrobiales-1]|jgi:precorrin-2 dehydrogenase/sirohydrochlorin ferrochelatase|nr:MAG: siroheme synthase [Methanomicrobiales archaeon HGW-Methanomicrobiales-1]